MGLIGTRSLDKQIPGIKEIKAKNRERIPFCVASLAPVWLKISFTELILSVLSFG